MSVVQVAQLEAARSACLAAVNSAQSALMTVESVIMAMDKDAVETARKDWGTFDTEPATPTGARHGRQAKK